ncbi:DNA-processing protein DprA [Curtobacterium pusillum]|uniref:DNA-protecting protein DprA n=1 Tax=Curtobacterium pusillum TaxID=69373 RepID=A0ABX2MFI2_9MICO|nr:DNA-processing protein DprA [Curtobacterium pusillum]NUU14059.1 DNA-protecting protein DprA [Curtobacterium pusillum]GLK29783.1 DNA processing protein DprA [Curtobacterium pusillum]
MTAAPDDVLARVAWSVLAEPGDVVAGELVTLFGAQESLAMVRRAVESGPDDLVGRLRSGVSFADGPDRVRTAIVAALERWRPRAGGADPNAAVTAGTAVGARLVVPGDPGWPTALDDLGPHAPFVLWSRSEQDDPVGAAGCVGAMAVVGCRANTVAGAEAAAEIASLAADAGVEIVSGGAYGIDAVAHRVAVAAGTPTTAVLAGGIDQFYPAGNHELLRNVLARGRVLSESPPGTRPTRWRFLSRNRLIAALSEATVVVEAAARSGALNTAHHAMQLGRPVFAVPGAFTSAASVGCHRLIAQGNAQIVVSPRDPITAVLTGTDDVAVRSRVAETVVLATDADPHVKRALDALDRRPIPVEEVARRSGLSVDDAADALALAQLEGLVTPLAEGWCRR